MNMQTAPERPHSGSTYEPGRVLRVVQRLLGVSESRELFRLISEYLVPRFALACVLDHADWAEPRVVTEGTPDRALEIYARGCELLDIANAHETPAELGDRLIRFPFRFSNRKKGALSIVGERAYDREADREILEIGVCGAQALARLFALEEAETALDHKERMVRIVSHELKGPLTTLQVGMDLLKPKKSRENFLAADLQQRMERSLKRMRGLIGGLLEASRYGRSAGSALSWKPVAISDLVSEVIEIQRPFLKEKSLRCELEWLTSPLTLEADWEGLFQVFSHLIGNAIRHSPNEGRIRIMGRTLGTECEFSIEDEGPGIPKGQERRIFEGFLQGQKDAGTPEGMELFIVKAVVEAHGGRIRAGTPDEARGAGIYFTLPMHREGGKLKPG